MNQPSDPQQGENQPRKFDHDKPQINLIPGVALIEMGKVLAFGAKKYDRGNWAKGLATSRYLDAAYRHMIAYNAGEDRDPESGLLHLAHAAVNMVFAIWNIVFRPDLDDRWDRPHQLLAPDAPLPAAHVPKNRPATGYRWWFVPDACWTVNDDMSAVYVSSEVAQRALEAALTEDKRKNYLLLEVDRA